MKFSKNIMTRLTEFFDSYNEKVNFLRNLSRRHKAPDEIILLVCCYLDQLGGCLFPLAGSSKHSFEKLLLTHSGESDEFSLISVADLAFDLLQMNEFADIFIKKPGRINIYAEKEKSLVKFIDKTGVALTLTSIKKLLESIYDNLKTNFRIHPYQTTNKSSSGYMDFVIESIMGTPKLKKVAPGIEGSHIKALIKDYTFTSILYREIRSKAVHEIAGITVVADQFWKMKKPYFVEWTTDWLDYNTYTLEFPSFFLIECLETCISCTKKAIIGKGLLPLHIWNAICDVDELEYLDTDSVEEAKPITLKLD